MRILKFDPQWNLVSSGLPTSDKTTFSPPLKYFDFPLYLGKRWEARSTETILQTGNTHIHVIRAVVAAKEKVTVPAGTFYSFKLVLDTELIEDGKRTLGKDVSWYAPAVHRTVRSEIKSVDPATGKVSKRIVQLLSFELR